MKRMQVSGLKKHLEFDYQKTLFSYSLANPSIKLGRGCIIIMVSARGGELVMSWI